ncbi:MAG: trypsin-like peptidase domain-containing protein [bacterium]|nr:trypsin-like peptidase domain-containing protein [bacterium]
MKVYLVAFSSILTITLSAGAQSAPHAYVPPLPDKAATDLAIHAIPQATVSGYLEQIGSLHAFDHFAGQNGFLKSTADDTKGYRVAAGYAADVAPEDLFADGFMDGAYACYEAAVVSADALAMRLVVDLSALQPDEEAWVIDPTVPRAHGPYTAGDHAADGCWLPTTFGDTAVLLARTTGGTVPQVGLAAISHFYEDLTAVAKELFCNNNLACETDATLLSASTGVGLMVVPNGGYDSTLCTGSLLNNSDTPAFEPYFLTSWHCVPDVVDADQVDVIWDFRTPTCTGSAPPPLGSLPRCSAEVTLTTSSRYDASLLRLESVPTGVYGRTYLGWTTSTPSINGAVVAIHHPEGAYLRISYGTVEGLNQAAGRFYDQTKVHWYSGVTENGSSGNPLLLETEGYRVIGTLSNGPQHSCITTVGNVDWYSSFRRFYGQASGWLTGTNPPPPDGATGGTGCAASKAFEAHPEVLHNLRALRDNGLINSAIGKQLIAAYYLAAPQLAGQVDQSPEARAAFQAVTGPLATLGAAMVGDGDAEE